jgi:hypothetical protein
MCILVLEVAPAADFDVKLTAIRSRTLDAPPGALAESVLRNELR